MSVGGELSYQESYSDDFDAEESVFYGDDDFEAYESDGDVKEGDGSTAAGASEEEKEIEDEEGERKQEAVRSAPKQAEKEEEPPDVSPVVCSRSLLDRIRTSGEGERSARSLTESQEPASLTYAALLPNIER